MDVDKLAVGLEGLKFFNKRLQKVFNSFSVVTEIF